MMRHALVLATFLVAAAAPAAASAEQLGLSFGGRVGGYGFRDAAPDTEGPRGWNDCRMNGIGLFAQKGLGRHFFAEAGLDAYFAEEFPTGGHDHVGGGSGMDRMSTLATVVGGVRLLPDAWLAPYLQVGAGVEFTRVAMPEYDMRESHVLPLGFIGLGADLRLWRGVRAGMNLRVHLMGHFEHDGAIMSAEPELASQAQFYAKVDL